MRVTVGIVVVVVGVFVSGAACLVVYTDRMRVSANICHHTASGRELTRVLCTTAFAFEIGTRVLVIDVCVQQGRPYLVWFIAENRMEDVGSLGI